MYVHIKLRRCAAPQWPDRCSLLVGQ